MVAGLEDLPSRCWRTRCRLLGNLRHLEQEGIGEWGTALKEKTKPLKFTSPARKSLIGPWPPGRRIWVGVEATGLPEHLTV